MAGLPIRKLEALVEVIVEDAMKAFWNSDDIILRALNPEWDLLS